ncbi:outer membrane protein assembly factor BamD [Alysiella filiformis]|uniref:Outer membrane protein assembly factor BamD n=1 Tax=Alysiella filiformis DSM 16848 TaxID=1120981 RepID=A0A286EE98_9NEIS|nr:outer membrane protein assembly factor BamD [Alysiella filiformis]QMT30929.1 outer membrane protein assembly factor BamD [Alysiella filiformis]UBQ56084.1 outer membrane protein assembly factor BamD [Alysiella filiformis DSM 16848]SOD69154.1 Beta-barrel assembly machine subunit BamD [Alysiella filiformis DSM 16848]
MKNFLLVISVAAALSACAAKGTVDKEAQKTQNWTIDQLYNEARNELNGNNYTRAVTLYELLRSREPDGRYAEQAGIETAYAHYKNEEKEKALAAIARFQQHFPASVDMDYALYLKGLVLFDEDQSFLNRLASQDWSDRDPAANRQAFYAFEELVKKYPQSKYADDSRKRMSQLVDALGGHEIAIARYYAKRGAWVAANNRAQRVIEQFQNTRYVEEALAIMVFSYKKMDKPQLAEDAERVLQKNFPQSPYLQKDWVPDDMPWWRYWK